MRATLLLPLILTCCSPEVFQTVVVVTDSSTITLDLLNPTVDAAPLSGVDGFRLEVQAGQETVASETFSWPEDELTMSQIQEYGVVRFQLAGLSGDRVISLGRSSEVVISPEEDLRVPMVFLPVNQAFALAEEMAAPRSHHTAIPLRDGRVLLVGGHAPQRTGSLDDTEIYDVASRRFSQPGASLSVSSGDHRFIWTNKEQLLIIGGSRKVMNSTDSVDSVDLFDPATDTMSPVTELVSPRRDHCAAQYIPNAVLVLGGPDTGTQGDSLRYWLEEATWRSTPVPFQDGFRSEDVTDCLADEDGKVLVLGTHAGNTGIWDGLSSESFEDAFTPVSPAAEGVPVEGAALVLVEPGRFWVGGGANTSSGVVYSSGQEFLMESASFVAGAPLAVPRQRASWDRWLDGRTIAVGCGWSDAEGANPVNRVEFLDPGAWWSGPTVDLDRSRPGCQVISLLDGSVLVTGGYDGTTSLSASSAAIIVPWWEE